MRRLAVPLAFVLAGAFFWFASRSESHDYKHACDAVPARVFADALKWQAVGKSEVPDPYGTKATLCSFRTGPTRDKRSAQVIELGPGSKKMYQRNVQVAKTTRVVDGDGYRAFIRTDLYGEGFESLFLLADGEYVNVNLEGFPSGTVEKLIPGIVENLY